MTTAEKKLVKHRLSVLELAQALGNVSEACRRRGLSRSRFYEYKRRFQTHGIEGPKDLPQSTRPTPKPLRPNSSNRSSKSP